MGLDDALAAIYEVPAPEVDFDEVELDIVRRRGVLTCVGWLGARASAAGTRRSSADGSCKTACSANSSRRRRPTLEVPPPEPLPDETTRQRYDTILAEPACASCHLAAHGLGYGFENYDAVGFWRDEENGLPIDAGGQIEPSLDPEIAGPFTGALELAAKLGESRVVHDCAARKAYMSARSAARSPRPTPARSRRCRTHSSPTAATCTSCRCGSPSATASATGSRDRHEEHALWDMSRRACR